MAARTVRIQRFHVQRIVFCSVLCGCLYYLVSSLKVSMYASLDRSLITVLYNETDRLMRYVSDMQRGSKERGDGQFESLIRTADVSEGVVPVAGHPGDSKQAVVGSQDVVQLPWCPSDPTNRDHNFPLNLNETTYEALIAEVGSKMQNGGHFLPSTCRSREHLAIIIPYRDRERNLHILLRNILPFLWRQMIEFTVFLVEQTAEFPFNKGVLFNAAYRESQKLGNFTCFVMQDVDLIPMDNRNLYRCGENPRHLCLTSGQTEWKNKLMYPMTFGGAIALRPSHIERANGFSVSYYGWGLEDDDLALRMVGQRIRISRYPVPVGKYYKLDHKKNPHNPQWNKLKKTIRKRQMTEGLNTLNYTLVRRESRPLYTWLLIRVPPPPPSIYGSPLNSTGQP